MVAGMEIVLQSNSLNYPISLPFMRHDKLNSESIMGEVEREL